MINVIIDDYDFARRNVISIDPDEIGKVHQQWLDEDPLLIVMQSSPLFYGKKRLSDLDQIHHRFLIGMDLLKYETLDSKGRTDPRHPVPKTLKGHLAALIYYLQSKTASTVESLKIVRVGGKEVSYDFTSSLNVSFDIKPSNPKPKSGFKIVIDNTKE